MFLPVSLPISLEIGYKYEMSILRSGRYKRFGEQNQWRRKLNKKKKGVQEVWQAFYHNWGGKKKLSLGD